MDLRHVKINGHDVAYGTAGDGPVVLLVHGMAGSSETWKHVIPALAKQFTVIAPDLLGHGEHVTLLERTLQEEEETDERLTELAESHVNEEALVR